MDSIGYRWCMSASKEITGIQDALALAHEHRAGSDLSIISLMYINSLRKQIEDVFSLINESYSGIDRTNAI